MFKMILKDSLDDTNENTLWNGQSPLEEQQNNVGGSKIL